ncbi:MAG TPA: GNAT family N-acetyltransferase [Herpetosiphonaceae bacterium]
MTQHQGVMARTRLSDEERAAALELAELCNRRDGLDLKLNPGMLQRRSGEHTDDFVYYADGKLVGFLGLYQFKQSEIEASGMVHPDYRRQGIFSQLYQAARQSCEQRGIPSILWINERRSQAGAAFVASTSAAYQFSEYVMDLDLAAEPAAPAHEIALRQASPADQAEIVELMRAGFGMEPEDSASFVTSQLVDPAPDRYLWLAESDGRTVGVIGTAAEGPGAYIFGFVVPPELRGQGYGRSILLKTVAYLRGLGKAPISLEVATENARALGLYQSCGFGEASANDYFAQPLGVAAG